MQNLNFVTTHRHPCLPEPQPRCHRLPHEYVRVVAGVEGALKLVQLPAAEVGAAAAVATAAAVVVQAVVPAAVAAVVGGQTVGVGVVRS